MKGKFVWILSALEIVIGLVLFLSAQVEISSNPWYSWRRPYTPYEAQIILVKWIGIFLVISGIVWLCLKIYQLRYTDAHTQEISPTEGKGGIVKCSNCGLTLSSAAESCPRCGNAMINTNTNIAEKNVVQFCGKCGSKLSPSEMYCPNCGQKISK